MEFNKKLFYIVGAGVGLLVILVFAVWLYGNIVGSTMEYSKIEDLLEKSTIKYLNANPKLWPVKEEEYKDVDASVLVNAGYIEELSEYVPDGVQCTAKVKVYYIDGVDYDVVPNLYCGNEYRTKYLKDIILDNLVVEGDGLYQRINNKFVSKPEDLAYGLEGSTYLYRGENVDNYVKIGSEVFRIVQITENEDFLLIAEEFLGGYSLFEWDDRYNAEIDQSWGINSYDLSRIRNSVNENFSSLSLGGNGANKLRYFSLCTDKYKATSLVEGIANCSNSMMEKIGLLPASNYVLASLDEKCVKFGDRSCGNYNYLSNATSSWWTVTANADNTHTAFYVSSSKYLDVSNAMVSYRLRPVVLMASSARLVSGDGTVNNPYVIR